MGLCSCSCTSLRFRQNAAQTPEGNVSGTSPASHSGVYFKRLERPRLIEVKYRIKLISEPGLKVITLALHIGPVNYANCPLEPGLAQKFRCRALHEPQAVARGRG